MLLPESIQSLINALERLPGIGPKSASRLAFYFLRATDDVSDDLALALAHLKKNTAFCQECFNITEAGRERCEICESLKRDSSVICVVEEALDVLALERTAGFNGKYHVLQGVLSPIEGIGPDDLKIKQLLARVANVQHGSAGQPARPRRRIAIPSRRQARHPLRQPGSQAGQPRKAARDAQLDRTAPVITPG